MFWPRSNRKSAPLFSRLTTRMRWPSPDLLGDAFLVTYMFAAPLLGWLADRFSRWLIVGIGGHPLESRQRRLGVGGHFRHSFRDPHFGRNRRRRLRTCRADHFGRFFPAGNADVFWHLLRGDSGRERAWLCSGRTDRSHLGWRWAFYLVMPPRSLLGLLCFTGAIRANRCHARKAGPRDRRRLCQLFRTRSYVLNTFAQTAMTFAIGGLGFWIAEYLVYRHQPPSTRHLFRRDHGGSRVDLHAPRRLAATDCDAFQVPIFWFRELECFWRFRLSSEWSSRPFHRRGSCCFSPSSLSSSIPVRRILRSPMFRSRQCARQHSL